MFQHIIVPIDESLAAWRVVPIAARMAAAVDGKLDLVTVVRDVDDVAWAGAALRDGVERAGDLEVDPHVEVLAHDSIVEALAAHVESRNGSIVVMSSHGHGRSASVLGSVANDVLRTLHGPVVVVGPHVRPEAGRLDGRYLVPLDGSDHAETILPIAAAWAVEFDAEPWVVEVVAPGVKTPADTTDSGYVARHARDLHQRIGREVEFDVLHHDDPAKAITDAAEYYGVSLVFATTHGRTGLARFRAGSVTADVVRRARCPVVLYRPPRLALD